MKVLTLNTSCPQFDSKCPVLSHYMSVPLWQPVKDSPLGFHTLYPLDESQQLGQTKRSQEIRVELAKGTKYADNSFVVWGIHNESDPYTAISFDYNRGVTWDGFNPTTDENVYGLKLFDNKAEWYGGNNKAALPLRITMHYTTTEDIYPKGPLP